MDPIYVLRKRAAGATALEAGRYVGITGPGAERKRLTVHFAEARRGDKTHKCNWIRSVDYDVTVDVLEWCLPMHREEREKYWIALFRDYGHRLTNLTDGGDGTPGNKKSPEAIAKTTAAHAGSKRTPEQRARLAAAWTLERRAATSARCKGVPRSPEFRAAMRKPHTKEHRERVRAAMLKTPSYTDLPKGVQWCAAHDKFVARLQVDKKRRYLGVFDTVEEAGLARDIAVMLYCPPRSFLNYPPVQVSATGPNFCFTFHEL